jgi:hypothetical protein
MATFRINEGYTSLNRNVTAARFVTNGDFVDFLNELDEIVLRVRATDVFTIERKD